jgi:hypothetical protein
VNAQLGAALLVGVGFIGMVVLFVALIFVHNPARFRRLIVGGLVMVASSMVLWWWLISSTFAERMG